MGNDCGQRPGAITDHGSVRPTATRTTTPTLASRGAFAGASAPGDERVEFLISRRFGI